MKIVIDLPKEIYDALYVDYVFNPPIRNGKTLFSILHKCIANGIPLPEHHGRLIDADNLIRTMEKDVRKAMSFVDLTDFVWLAPTIIEADKEDVDGK